MALSAEQIVQAKNKAKDYVEYSLYVLALLLNVDLEDIDEHSTNPIAPSNTETYNAYECLLMQAKVYISLAS